MKSFWIIFTLQTYVFCNDQIPKSIQDTIRKNFGYDCEYSPRIEEILFWKISIYNKVEKSIHPLEDFTKSTYFEPQKYIRGITQFQSTDTYFILTKLGYNQVHMFYWVGSQALLDDKKKAAEFALEHYSQLRNYYNTKSVRVSVSISRERDSKESELFHHIMISPILKTSIYLHKQYLRTGILTIYPNLYAIKGSGDSVRMKKVPMGTAWLKNDTCLVLKTNCIMGWNLKVYTYCGTMASTDMNYQAKCFAFHLGWLFGINLAKRFQYTEIRDRTQLKSFIELLEDKFNYTLNEVDNSNDHLKDAETFVKERDARISLSRIFVDSISNIDEGSYITLSDGLLKKVITGRPISFANVGLHNTNHILNTDSISGVFVHFGSTVLKEAVLTMQYAEEYVHDIESTTSRPTPLHIDGATVPNYTLHTVDLKINFIDYYLPQGRLW